MTKKDERQLRGAAGRAGNRPAGDSCSFGRLRTPDGPCTRTPRSRKLPSGGAITTLSDWRSPSRRRATLRCTASGAPRPANRQPSGPSRCGWPPGCAGAWTPPEASPAVGVALTLGGCGEAHARRTYTQAPLSPAHISPSKAFIFGAAMHLAKHGKAEQERLLECQSAHRKSTEPASKERVLLRILTACALRTPLKFNVSKNVNFLSMTTRVNIQCLQSKSVASLEVG